MSLTKRGKTEWEYDPSNMTYRADRIDLTFTKDGLEFDADYSLIPWEAIAAARDALGLESWEDEDLARYLVERGVDLEAIGEIGAKLSVSAEVFIEIHYESAGRDRLPAPWLKAIAAMKLEGGSVTGWQTIETAPRDGTRFLLYDNAYMMVAWFGWYENEGQPVWFNGDTTCIGTHWIPLPAPPNGTEQPAPLPTISDAQFAQMAQERGWVKMEGTE